MAFPKFVKDPEAVLDYEMDWSAWLAGAEDAIEASQWSAADGLTVVTHTHGSATATVWLSGGEVGQSYTVTNEITTEDGRTDDRSITIQVKQK